MDITKGVEVYVGERRLFTLEKKEGGVSTYIIKYKPLLSLTYKYNKTSRSITLRGKNMTSDLMKLIYLESIYGLSKIDFVGSVNFSLDLTEYPMDFFA